MEKVAKGRGGSGREGKSRILGSWILRFCFGLLNGCFRVMHLVYCVIGVKGGLKGWTVLRCGAAVRSAKGKGQKEKGQKGKLQTKNKSIKHKSLGIKSSFWG